MIYNKKLKPSLIDQNIIGEYMKNKMITQMALSGPQTQTQTELQKLSTKIFYNIINFIYHYFLIIAIFGGIGYYMYKRYIWYQEIKKTQTEKQVKEQDEQMKKYFDNIMEVNQSNNPNNLKINPTNQTQQELPNQSQAYFVPGKKLDKVVSGNNIYLNHIKNTFDTTQSHKTSMGRIQPTQELTTKTVRFAQGDFDAYGRNNLNPKTGETLVKQFTSPEFQKQNQIQPYDSNNGSSFSSF